MAFITAKSRRRSNTDEVSVANTQSIAVRAISSGAQQHDRAHATNDCAFSRQKLPHWTYFHSGKSGLEMRNGRIHLTARSGN